MAPGQNNQNHHHCCTRWRGGAARTRSRRKPTPGRCTRSKALGTVESVFKKSVIVVHFGPKRYLYILWRLCLPVDVTRSPARNSCLNKCSLLSRPPIHEQIYNQEDLGLSHRHLFNDRLFVLYYFCFHVFQPEHCLPQAPHPAYTGECLLMINVVRETRLLRHIFPYHDTLNVYHNTDESLLMIKVVRETRLRRQDIWFAIMMMAMIMVTIFMIMMTRSDNDVNQDKQKPDIQVSPAAQLHGSARPCTLLVVPQFCFFVLSQVVPIY